MTTIVRMWSGPRNLSTALMRSWDSRADTAVLDEPLYAHYLAKTGADHPGISEIIGAGRPILGDAIDRCEHPPLEPGQTISYQKHMAHHLLPNMDLAWIQHSINFLLVRHPRRVIASYSKVRNDVTLEDLAFPQLVALKELLPDAPVVDADTFLNDPESELRRHCRWAGVSFDPAMLGWQAGSRESDGVWARYWYGSVEASTGFAPAPTNQADSIPLPAALEPVAAAALEMYNWLWQA